ncbi:MAG: HDOD domain-containing protein, partial [FCB group bacterium]|nr:HDOD domain-containing protein [FCB group bacterium]
MDSSKLRAVIDGIDDLPTLSSVAAMVMDLLNSSDSTASELSKLISADQGLTLRILRMANSSYYGFPRQIGTINLAIVVLGFDTVKSLTLSLSIQDSFREWKSRVKLDFQEYWKHSLYTAAGSRFLAKSTSYVVPGEAFVAGLVHDVGKLVISGYLHDEYDKIHKLTDEGGQSDYDAEMEVLSISHGEIGGWLTEKWGLPAAISDAVKNHHHPLKSEIDTELSAIINISDRLSHLHGLTPDVMEEAADFDREAWKTLRMRLKPSGKHDNEYYFKAFEDELNSAES